MIDEIFGLPAHPLLVHAAVVFGPLLVAVVVGYSLVPPLRKMLGWAVVALAFMTPVALWFAQQSGEQFLERQKEAGAQGELLVKIAEHENFGTLAAWWGTALGLLALLLVLVATAAARAAAEPEVRAVISGFAVFAVPAAAVRALLVLVTTVVGTQPETLRSRAITYGLIVLNLVTAAATAYYTVRAGHTGSSIVWGS